MMQSFFYSLSKFRGLFELYGVAFKDISATFGIYQRLSGYIGDFRDISATFEIYQ